ncbi:MAG: peptidase [Candidatus Schekmanbacteria bacterium]|nr:MAG: peptidase [Candidatus Schekmanbacteria bacterium]
MIITERAIKKLIEENLGIKRNERVLIFCDDISEDETITESDRKRRSELPLIAEEIFDYLSKRNDTTFLQYESLEKHGMEPPELIWQEAFGKRAFADLRDKGIFEKLITKQSTKKEEIEAEKIIKKHKRECVDVIIALSNFSTSHTKFRDLHTRIAGGRYASMPLFDKSMFEGPLNVNHKKMRQLTENLAKKLSRAKTAVITASNGTNLKIGIEGRSGIADTGILTRKGAFGNLPAGEAFIAPVENSAEGLFVAEWGPTSKFKKPLKFEIKSGKLFLIQGIDDYADFLREQIELDRKSSNIAELGIGTNPKATKPDNILESEKILGTIHLALGDNKSFGGEVRTNFHQDFVLFNPTLKLLYGSEEETIIANGKLLKS